MSANTFGHILKYHSFGESHGQGMGVVIEGCPSGVTFSLDILKKELKRRRPGHSPWTSSRVEPDEPQVLSGVYEGKTLGTPIAIIVFNKDARSKDYDVIKKSPRVGHADDLWKEKFQFVDHRGGGRSSGRETLSRVLAGAVARMLIKEICSDFKIMAFVRQIDSIAIKNNELDFVKKIFDKDQSLENYPASFPHKEKSKEVSDLLVQSKEEGESLSSLVELWIDGVPSVLGQPVFHKMKSDLTSGMMSLGAITGIEVGSGLSSLEQKGSEFHDNPKNYGGLRGGLTTGEPLVMRMVFKPPSSIKDIAKKGRHDPCIGPRAVPVVEAIACSVIADHLLWKRLDRI